MNWLVKDTDRLSGTIHEAFHIATHGRPGPVLVDIPKDVQFATGSYTEKPKARIDHYQPRVKGDTAAIDRWSRRWKPPSARSSTPAAA
jgi:acetolactate synthase-1/2/3 large subunit